MLNLWKGQILAFGLITNILAFESKGKEYTERFPDSIEGQNILKFLM